MHNRVPNSEEDVWIVSNYITDSDIMIDGQKVPAGSWVATLGILDKDINQAIDEGQLTGFSLGSLPKNRDNKKLWFVNKSQTKQLTYSDLNDAEEVDPIFISTVDKANNQFTFEVLEYEGFINKNKPDGENLTNTEKTENKEEMISVSSLEKIKSFLINKNEPTPEVEETVIEKSEDDPKIAKLEEDIKALKDDLAKTNDALKVIAEAVDKEKEVEEETTPAENTTDASVEKDTKTEEEEDEEDKVEKNSINKSVTGKINNTETIETKSFKERTGRNAFGIKIK